MANIALKEVLRTNLHLKSTTHVKCIELKPQHLFFFAVLILDKFLFLFIIRNQTKFIQG
jgi:hypothetical protein